MVLGSPLSRRRRRGTRTTYGNNHRTIAGRNTEDAVGNQGLSNKVNPFTRHSRRNPVKYAAKIRWRERFGKKRGTRYLKSKSFRGIAATQ